MKLFFTAAVPEEISPEILALQRTARHGCVEPMKCMQEIAFPLKTSAKLMLKVVEPIRTKRRERLAAEQNNSYCSLVPTLLLQEEHGGSFTQLYRLGVFLFT